MEFLIYLLKVNIAVIAFYAIYRLVFHKDTFFAWKRMMLLVMIVFSPVAIQIEKTFSFAKIFPNILLISYLIAVAYCLFRLVAQLISIFLIVKNSEKCEIFGQEVLVNQQIETPFSFFGKIVLSDKNYSVDELQAILLHEETHKRQCHSLDVLFAELLCVLVWFNPLTWQLKREIRLNLEFLADRSVLLMGCEVEHYQLNLLKISYNKSITSITNNFNFSFLKKRILMMKKKNSNSRAILKYALLLPVIALLVGVNVSVNAENGKELENWLSQTAETLTNAVMPPQTQTKKATVQFTPPQYVVDDSSQRKTYEFKTKAGTAILSGMTGEPIYVFNGKIVSKSEMDIIKSDEERNFRSMGAIKVDEAIVLFGEQGKNGAFFLSDETSDDELFAIHNPEKTAEFPGGMEALLTYIQENLRYPVNAMKNNIQGRTLVGFVIEKDGSIQVANVLNGFDPDCDAEAVRVVKSMPKWKPAENKGRLVRMQFALPISFKLQENQEASFMKGSEALIFVDGKEVNEAVLKAIKPEEIDSVSVLKGKNATEKYGEKAKNGVIEVKLKTTKKTDNMHLRGENLENILYILDGKEITYEEFTKISEQNIDSFSVLKGKNATEKYGEKAKNGVIELKLKGFHN